MRTAGCVLRTRSAAVGRGRRVAGGGRGGSDGQHPARRTVDHADLTRRWEIVEAFMAAAREGVGAHGIRLWRRSYEGPRARWMSYVDSGS